MADHRYPGTSCHLITEARSVGLRVVPGWIWLVRRLPRESWCTPILLILAGPRGSGPNSYQLSLPFVQQMPRWLKTCPDLGISAGVAFNLLGGKSASRLGTRTSFCR